MLVLEEDELAGAHHEHSGLSGPLRRAGVYRTSALRLSALVTQRTGEAPVLARATSGEEGSFSLEGLKPGRYSLWVESAEGTGLRRDVAAGEEGVELVLAEGVRVSGAVRNEEKGPVVGALVTAIFTAHSRFFETITDATGQFRLGPLPRGEYVLLVSSDHVLACAEHPDGRIALPMKPEERELRVVLLREASVCGQFLQKDGSPITSFVVNDQGWNDPEGRFSVPIRCTGTLQLELVVAGDEVPGSRRVRHSVSVREEVDMDLAPIVLDGK